jgi:hypothetical protein
LDSALQYDKPFHKAIAALGSRVLEKIQFCALDLAISDAQAIEDFLRLDSFESRPDLVRQDSEVWPGARHSPLPRHLRSVFS